MPAIPKIRPISDLRNKFKDISNLYRGARKSRNLQGYPRTERHSPNTEKSR